MNTLAFIIPVCWGYALLATPRKPRLDNEVEELVYTRLLGRQQLLVGVAAIVTAATVLGLVVTLPRRIDPTLARNRQLNTYCAAAAADAPFCYRLEPDGEWLEAARQSEGQWVVVGIVAAPAFSPVCPTPGRGVDDPPSVSLAFRCS
jgi:hypothetical protein